MKQSLLAAFVLILLFSPVGALVAAGQDVIVDDEDFDDDPAIVDEDNFGSKFIRVEPAVIKVGDIFRGETLTRTVRLTNITHSPVHITRVFATCICTVPEAPEEPIQPGETIEVKIEVTGKAVGRSINTVRFFLSENRGDVRVTVRAVVRSPIEAEPAVYRAESTENQSLRVFATDGAEFRIMAIDPPIVEGIDDQRRIEHTLQINAAKLREAGRRGHSLRIYTDHQRVDSMLIRSDRLDTRPQVQALLMWAQGTGEVDRIVELVEEGVDVNEADPQGRTPLMIAAQSGEFERVWTLMQYGADVNQRAKDNQTALMKAAQAVKGTVELVQLLLDAGSDVNARDQFGRTPLFWAARNGDPARIGLLIERGAEVNARGPSGETPLVSAIKSRNVDGVKVLLAAGGDPTIPDARSRRAIDHAKIMREMIRGDDDAAVAARAAADGIITLLEQRVN